MLVKNIGNLACVPGVFVGSAGLKNFSLFWPRETLGERIKVQKLPLPHPSIFVLTPIFARPETKKILVRADKPAGMLERQAIGTSG